MNHRMERHHLNSAGLLVVSAVLVLIAVWSSVTPPEGLPAGHEPVGDTSMDVSRNAHVPVPSGVSVTRPVLVLNSDGSATLSASLATTDKEVALAGVQVAHQGVAQEISSTQMWLPVIPGVGATVGAASDAGGFIVPSGLTTGDIADVHFIFDDRTCVNVEAEVVQRTARHREVFPKRGSRLDPADRVLDSLTSTCADPAKSL